MKVSHPRLVPTDRVWLTLIEGTDFSQKRKKERKKKNISPSYHLSPCHLQSLTKNQNFFVLKSLSSSSLPRFFRSQHFFFMNKCTIQNGAPWIHDKNVRSITLHFTQSPPMPFFALIEILTNSSWQMNLLGANNPQISIVLIIPYLLHLILQNRTQTLNVFVIRFRT